MEKSLLEKDAIIEELRDSKASLVWMKQIQNENKTMKAELKSFRHDCRETAWYKQMHEEKRKLHERYLELQMAFNKLLVERNNEKC